LGDADARLTVPEPARSRILLEIAADMEGLYGEYVDRGLTEEDAEAAVMDHFDLSDEVLRELVRVHDKPLERSLETLSGQVRGPWSSFLLVLFALFVIVGSGALLFKGQVYRDASGLVWIVIPILVVGLAMAARRTWGLLRAGEEWGPNLGSGLGRLLGLSILILGVTAGGLWLELYLSALHIRAVPGDTLIHLVGWLQMASATLVIALSSALVLGFFWFFLDSQVRRRELQAAANLLQGIG
jgi:hypothetical protein